MAPKTSGKPSNSQASGWIRPWLSIERKKADGGKLTALESFILENEPGGLTESQRFRRGLRAVLEEQSNAKN